MFTVQLYEASEQTAHTFARVLCEECSKHVIVVSSNTQHLLIASSFFADLQKFMDALKPEDFVYFPALDAIDAL